jgi:hypothetical protein
MEEEVSVFVTRLLQSIELFQSDVLAAVDTAALIHSCRSTVQTSYVA